RKPLQELTAATGLSPKTARKHLERLLREELLLITPRLGTLGDSGELVYTAAVFGAVTMADLRRALGDVFLINELQEPPARFLLCRGTPRPRCSHPGRPGSGAIGASPRPCWVCR